MIVGCDYLYFYYELIAYFVDYLINTSFNLVMLYQTSKQQLSFSFSVENIKKIGIAFINGTQYSLNIFVLIRKMKNKRVMNSPYFWNKENNCDGYLLTISSLKYLKKNYTKILWFFLFKFIISLKNNIPNKIETCHMALVDLNSWRWRALKKTFFIFFYGDWLMYYQ